jgi:hypothetical protein
MYNTQEDLEDTGGIMESTHEVLRKYRGDHRKHTRTSSKIQEER